MAVALAAASCIAMGSRAADSSAATGDLVTGAWQHHKMTISYVGFTSLYTCDGLEDHVRMILLHLGARKDVKVSATGCPGPYNTPSHIAWVNADFHTLSPATDSSGSDAVQARWTAVEAVPRRPAFMGDGDCELIHDMKDLVTQGFSLRGVEYRTNCIPYSINLDSFAVKAQVLREVPPARPKG